MTVIDKTEKHKQFHYQSIATVKELVPFDIVVIHKGNKYFATVTGRKNKFADVYLRNDNDNEIFACYQYSWEAILRAYHGTELHT